MNPQSAARQAYAQTPVQTASKEQLVILLYDGAIRFLRQSAEAMRCGNREQSRNRMRRAEAIIDELNMALDLSYGEIPDRLRSIYQFCKRHLIQANLTGDDAAIETVARLLAELRASWAQVAASHTELAAV